MKMRIVVLLGVLAVVSGLVVRQGLAEKPAARPAGVAVKANVQKNDPKAGDKEAIAKNAEAFVETFHKGDASALAEFWTEKGDYTTQRGKTIKGRRAIEASFKELFAENKGLKLRINSNTLRFITDDVAIEDGTTEVYPPNGGPPSQARYTIVHMKKDGKWRIDSVRDAMFVPPTNYDHLRKLDFYIGDWASEGKKGAQALLTFSWAEHQNFIHSTFTTAQNGISVASGHQVIGWDPTKKEIRAWLFEANGGFGDGVYTLEEGKVSIKVSFTTRDGQKVASTNIITRVDDDTITWQAKDRTLDGKPIDDVKPTTLKRVK